MPQLVITEKPKVAERVASAIADGAVQRKMLGGVAYYACKRKGMDIFVAPAVGHLFSLRQVGKGSSYPVFDIEWVPSSDVNKESAFTKKYVTLLRSLAKKSDSFVVACDYDIEGSVIGFNVLRFCAGTEKGERMKFSALTKEDLEEAWESRSKLDFENIWAGEARHVLDWLWGINLSRALMSAIKSAGVFKVLSIGRVQGPALELLSQREREIASFKPVPYWEVSAIVRDVRFLHEKGRFFKLEEAEAALENSDRKGAVVLVTRRDFEVQPDPPFDLTSLQIASYAAFGIPPAQTLEVAQSLYEASLISYPRTSSQKLPEKLNLPKIIKELGNQAAYSALASRLVGSKRFKPREGKKEDPAHPAIYPTGLAPRERLSEREAKVYDLIVKRFLACFAENAVRESMKIVVRLGSEAFGASGSRTKSEGWFAFYSPYVRLEEAVFPDFREGEAVEAEGVSLEEKKTQPPKRFTPASVIEELEKRELGTKATRAGIIETLYNRGYLEDKAIKVTQFGLAVVSALEHNCPEILDAEMTRSLEGKMEKIQEGTVKKDEVIEEGKRFLEKILAEFKEKEKQIGGELLVALKQTEVKRNILGKCVNCKKGDLRILRSRFGKFFVGCSSYPECKTAYPLPQGASVKSLEKPCPSCGTPTIRVFRKARRPFEMCLLPTCETKKDWAKPAQKKEEPAQGQAPAVAEAPAAKSEPAKEQAPASAEAPAKKTEPAKRQAPVKKEPSRKKQAPGKAESSETQPPGKAEGV